MSYLDSILVFFNLVYSLLSFVTLGSISEELFWFVLGSSEPETCGFIRGSESDSWRREGVWNRVGQVLACWKLVQQPFFVSRKHFKKGASSAELYFLRELSFIFPFYVSWCVFVVSNFEQSLWAFYHPVFQCRNLILNIWGIYLPKAMFTSKFLFIVKYLFQAWT